MSMGVSLKDDNNKRIKLFDVNYKTHRYDSLLDYAYNYYFTNEILILFTISLFSSTDISC